MKSSRGNMAHKVMTLLKMALRELRCGEVAVGVAEAWMSLLSSAVTKDAFWYWSRRFVKYCGGCREECWNLSPCAHEDRSSPTCPVDNAPWSPVLPVSPEWLS